MIIIESSELTKKLLWVTMLLKEGCSEGIKTSTPDRLRQFHDSMLKLEGLVETNTMLILQKVSNEFKPEYFEKCKDN